MFLSTLEPGHTRITLKGGITYIDNVTMGFSMTVDPEKTLEVNSGIHKSVIVIVYNCNYFADDKIKGCSNMLRVPFQVQAPGKTHGAFLIWVHFELLLLFFRF